MKKKTLNLVVYSLLIALMILMTFTAVGYIKIGIVEITLMCLPVIFGIAYSGTASGLILGLVFGLTSLSTCILGTSAFGTALFSLSAPKTVFLCVVPRVLAGLVCALCFTALYKSGKKNTAFTVASVLMPALNTLLFVSSFILLFKNTEFFVNMMNSVGSKTLPAFVITVFGLNSISEIGVCLIVGLPVCKAIDMIKSKK